MINLNQSVTLTQGQSISLLTGKITDVAVATMEANTRPSLRSRNEKGLRANYLVALQYMIEKDPSIPGTDLAGNALPLRGYRQV